MVPRRPRTGTGGRWPRWLLQHQNKQHQHSIFKSLNSIITDFNLSEAVSSRGSKLSAGGMANYWKFLEIAQRGSVTHKNHPRVSGEASYLEEYSRARAEEAGGVRTRPWTE